MKEYQYRIEVSKTDWGNINYNLLVKTEARYNSLLVLDSLDCVYKYLFQEDISHLTDPIVYPAVYVYDYRRVIRVPGVGGEFDSFISMYSEGITHCLYKRSGEEFYFDREFKTSSEMDQYIRDNVEGMWSKVSPKIYKQYISDLK
jgi:hypothetical protein